MNRIYLLLFISLLTISCNSVKRTKKYVAKGDYDKAIALAVKKLQKDKNAKEYDAHIGILEDAYKKATEEDARHLAYLKKQKSDAGKREIYHTYLNMVARQNLIRPLLPLYSRSMKRDGRFDFRDYSSHLVQAEEEFIGSLYRQAKEFMSGNTKQDARDAHMVLRELTEIQPNYKDAQFLMEEAHFQGTDFIYVNLNNHTGQMIPIRLQRDLLDFDTYGLDDFWTVYHSQREKDLYYDLVIELNFQTIEISPERILEKEYVRKRRVKDGYDYKRNRGGEIVRDSLGNPIKIDRMANVSARITVTTQLKNVFMGGTVVYLSHRNQPSQRFPLSSEFIFENVFASYRGDKRALSLEDLNWVANNFHPFPSNEQMVFNAGQDIKEQLKEILMQNPPH